MKIVTVVGARPQFIKASAISRAIVQYNERYPTKAIKEILLHTGQHYDEGMSAVFFDQMDIPRPAYELGILEKTHGAMTGKMLQQIEEVLMDEKPDLVLVYGDTNSTLAGTLAAVKIHIPVAHVEAGLRSFNMSMPEEINRIITDRVSTLLFCPTKTAERNLSNEGISEGVILSGDVMFDATLFYREKAKQQYSLDRWGLYKNQYVLCTFHRAENTDKEERLESILMALREIANDIQVVIPIHPRTKKMIQRYKLSKHLERLRILDPVSYLEMIRLEISAKAIMTDSGGVQKEAYFHKVPCLTIRDETEWIETIDMGWNRLCDANKATILNAWHGLRVQNEKSKNIFTQESQPYGNGMASQSIVGSLTSFSDLF